MKNTNIINANMFIIPNRPATVDKVILDSYKSVIKEEIEILNSMNNYDIPENDKMFQIWVCNESIDNFSNTRPINTNGEKLSMENDRIFHNIPYTMIKDIKEGDTITFNYSYDKVTGLPITLNLTAKQLDYRYRRFGSFEEVVADLK